MKRFNLANLFILFLSVLYGCGTVVADPVVKERAWTETYPVSANIPQLVIRNIWGDVKVRAGVAGQISVTVKEYRSAPSQTEFERWRQLVNLDVEVNNAGVTMLVGDSFNQWQRRDLDPCKSCRLSYQFDVSVPVDAYVEVSTVTDGIVDVADVNGMVSAKNVNGPVAVSNLHNCLTVKSINGALNLDFSRAPSTDCNVSTINGDITMVMPAGTGLDAATNIGHGSIRSEFDLTPLSLAANVEQVERNGRHIYRIKQPAGVQIGKGGPMFTVSSFNGDLLIKKKL